MLGKLLLSLPGNFYVVSSFNVSGYIYMNFCPSHDLYQSFHFQNELHIVFELNIVPAGVETQVF